MKFSKFTTLVLLAAIITCSNAVYAKENTRASKAKISIKNNFARFQENKNKPEEPLNLEEITDEDLAQADPNEILRIIAPYKNDKDYGVKSRAFFIERRLAHLHKQDVKLRQRVVDDLIEAHLTKSMSTYNDLMEFTQKDFSKDSKKKILNALNMKSIYKGIVEICGVANIPEALPILEKLLFDETEFQARYAGKTSGYIPKWYHNVGWKARLARARMGNKDDINKCISLIEHEVDTKGQYRVLKDLGYIHQPESIESLKKYFLSDLRRRSRIPGEEGMSYSRYLMPILGDNF